MRVRRWWRDEPLAFLGLGLVGVLVLVALLAPLLAPYDPTDVGVGPANQGPTADHWFGTDAVGRDLLSRVIYGARVSLRVGIGASAIAIVAGVVIGAAAGWYGRWVDGVLMRATDALLAIPYLVLALAVVAALGPGEGTVIVVLGIFSWMPVARLVRVSILQEREHAYVKAARALGYRDLRVLLRHVLPATIQPVVVLASIGVGGLILTEATLSFIGAGVQDPTPSWGLMLNQARGGFDNHPHLLFFPAAAVFVTVIAFVLLGDALGHVLDPRSRRSR